MTIRRLAPTLSLLVAIAGCETTGLVPEPDAGVDVDSGPALPRTLSYTPEGCGYEVPAPASEAAADA